MTEGPDRTGTQDGTTLPGMPNSTRIRTTDTPCPRCGTPLKVQEVGITVAEFAEPVKWAPQRRFCPHGHLFTADELD